jgi:hypothetical protein
MAVQKWLLMEAAMAIDREMQEYARDCVRLAGKTDDPIMREQFMKMSRYWMDAAAEQPPAASLSPTPATGRPGDRTIGVRAKAMGCAVLSKAQAQSKAVYRALYRALA